MKVKMAVEKGLVKSIKYNNTGAKVTDNGSVVTISRLSHWNTQVEENIRLEVSKIVVPYIKYVGWGGKEMGYVVEVWY